MKDEIWAKVDEGGFYDGLYEISNFGRFKQLSRILKTIAGKGWRKTKEKIVTGTSANGYMRVQLKKDRVRKQIDVHILVARAFIPNPNNLPHVNHKNAIRSDNYVDNLEWVTPGGNVNHAIGMGLHWTTKGSERANSKLDEEKVREIRRLYLTGKHSYRSLAALFGITYSHVDDIVNRKRWKHIL